MSLTCDKVTFPFNFCDPTAFYDWFRWFEKDEYLFIFSDKVFKKWDRNISKVVAQSQILSLDGHCLFGDKLFVYGHEEIKILSLDTLETLSTLRFSKEWEWIQINDIVYIDNKLFVIASEYYFVKEEEDGEQVTNFTEGFILLFCFNEKSDGIFDEHEFLGRIRFKKEDTTPVTVFSQSKIVVGFERKIVVADVASKTVLDFDISGKRYKLHEMATFSETEFLIRRRGETAVWNFNAEAMKLSGPEEMKKKRDLKKELAFQIYPSFFKIDSPVIYEKVDYNLCSWGYTYFLSYYEKAIYIADRKNLLRIDLKDVFDKLDLLQSLLERKEKLGRFSQLNEDVLEKIFSLI